MNAERAALLVAGGTAALLLAALHLTLSAPAITVDTVAPAPVAASASPQTGPQTGPQTDAPTSPQTRPQPAPAHPAPNHPDPLATAPPRGPIQIETLGPPGRSRPVVAGEIIFVFGPATAPATARRHLADAGFTLLHWHPALGAARAAVPPGLSVRDALAHAAATPNLPAAAPNALAWAADADDPTHTLTATELAAHLAAADGATATATGRRSREGDDDDTYIPLDPWAAPTPAEIAAVTAAIAREQTPPARQQRAARDAARAGEPLVAIVDSGIVYQSAILPWGAFLRAAPFDAATILPGWDFVREHALALDENQHGTHIASTLLKTAANEIRLLPIKVLDRLAIGTEYDVARGMLHAIENDADIINLSLTFGLHYVPSPLFAEVLDRCHESDVLVIAAAGNDFAQTISYPAALRDIIAVSAEHPDHTPWANRGAALDLVDRGGELPLDSKGIESPTFDLYRPARPAKVRLIGTSMAAAHTARTVALILRDLRIEGLLPAGPPGARVDFLRHVVTHSARPQGDGEFHRTWGLGKPDHGKARDLARRLVQENLVSAIIGERIGAAAQTTVFIEALGGTADRRGLALVEVRAPDGRPLANARLHGDWEGATRGAAECLTDGWGRCLLATPAITDSALADSAGLLVGLTLHRALAADGRALAIRPADRYDATRAATLGDTAITLERITAADPLDPDTLDSETLALLALRDPLTDQPLYCLGRDCPGFTLALGDPGDLFRIGHRRIYLVTRYPGGTPGPDSLLAGRTLTPSYQYRRHGRELQGGGLTLAFDEAFHATARDALGDDMHPIDDGIRLGSTGPGEPLIWVNDLTADVIVEGTGMMISGLTPIEYSFKFWGATLFYAINVQGTGMMISGLSVKFRSTGDFFSYNLAAIGSAWKTYGSALLDSTHPPFVFLGLGDP